VSSSLSIRVRVLFLTTGMDNNMVFILSTEFRGIEEEVVQMCLGSKEVVFEKPEESSQHMKPLYVQGSHRRKADL
jgi:hypothetical protein